MNGGEISPSMTSKLDSCWGGLTPIMPMMRAGIAASSLGRSIQRGAFWGQ